MSTANEIWIPKNGKLYRLDLPDNVALLPTFQANDRTKPDTIQSDYSPEFEASGTAHNHWLLGQAAASQPAQGSAYVRVPCTLTSGGVEVLPLALLYLKGYSAGRYQLQLAAGFKRLAEIIADKTLSDLDLNRFNHIWNPANILAGLPYAHWQTQGWGYELYDRGKPLDLQAIDPYTLYPSCSAELVKQQLLTDAGFTADSLLGEPLFAALNVPTANPYQFPQKFRDERQLTAGYFYNGGIGGVATNYHHSSAFASEQLVFSYTAITPYRLPAASTGAGYSAGEYTAGTLGYYDIAATIPAFFGCNERLPGKVRVKFMLLVNGQSVFDSQGTELGKEEEVSGSYLTKTFLPKLSRYLLQPGDRVTLFWRGDSLPTAGAGPDGPQWTIGPYGNQYDLPGTTLTLATEVRLTVTMLGEFPPGGLVKLQDWLPEGMKQLDFLKAYFLFGGITCQVDQYTPHLRLATGAKLLANIPRAKDWTRKRDAFAQPGRLPERTLEFRFGGYGRTNFLKWEEDDHVTTGYADGSIVVADEVLDKEYELAKLPFAATEASTAVAGLLRIGNFEAQDLLVTPIVYNTLETKPRATLRAADLVVSGQLVMVPANANTNTTQQLQPFTTTASYFDGVALSLVLDKTVLGTHWADLRAMLDQSRYLTEYYRLTPADIAGIDFSVPVWDAILGDYFAVSQISEYDARRPVEVKLVRLNAAHLPPPVVLGGALAEWWVDEFGGAGEWY